MKTCTKCGAAKELAAFYADRQKRDGYSPQCKSCVNADPARLARSAAWKQANRAKMSAYKRAVYVAHPRPPKDPTAPTRAKRAWKQRNPEKVASDRQSRRRRESRAAWGDPVLIAEHYHLAKLRSKLTGIPWHVDHVVPLRSPLVCGLHVEANLAVVPAAVNLVKGAKWQA